MEEQQLNDAIHGAIFERNIRKYKEIKDFYKEINFSDLSNIKIEILNDKIKVFEWILANPEYDFNALFDSYYLEHEKYGYTNEELYKYFEIYYEDLLFTLDRYKRKEYIIKLDDYN